ncbi:MAG: T9SS type A sorting domain-containing protein [bacterium]|nr:T9SS type A sorting domain-containing protein [bacterium]
MIRRTWFLMLMAVFAFTMLANAQPIPVDITNFDMNTGEVASRMRTQNGTTAMPLESIVHVILDSLNNGISTPSANGLPTGDDRLCGFFRVGAGTEGELGAFYATVAAFSQAEAGRNMLIAGRQFYLRGFNTTDSTIPPGTWYATSTRAGGVLPTVPTGADFVDGWLWPQVDSTNNVWARTSGIVVTAPLTGVQVNVGNVLNVQWNAIGVTGNVAVEINRNYPNGTWTTLTTAAASAGSYAWTATAPTSANAMIRVSSVVDPGTFGLSGTFQIIDVGLLLTQPNGGETAVVGTPYAINWVSTGLTGNVNVELKRNYPAGTWEVLGTALATAGTYNWNVTGAVSTTARVRVMQGTAIGDTSDANFTITSPSFSNIYPGTGTTDSVWTWNPTSISWASQFVTGNVRIELNRNYPTGTWVTLFANTTNDLVESWTATMPGTTGATARLRITSITDPTITAMSTNSFVITPSTVAITAPNTAVTWYVGDTETISWINSFNMPLNGTMRIQLNREYPAGSWTTIVDNTPNDSIQTWVVSGSPSTTARLRIMSTVDTLIIDESNVNFTIAQRSITVNVPNGGESWLVGSNQNITWASTGLTGNVNIELNRNYPGATWESIAAGTTNDGTHAWTVTGPFTNVARVRITSVAFPTVADTSNANFTVRVPTIAIHTPNGGESWVIGSSHAINWASADIVGNVRIQLKRDYPTGTWENLFASTANDTTENWTVTGPASTTARVRILSVTDTTIGDTSSASFSIVSPTITVTAPNTNVSWMIGSTQNIAWTSSNVTGNVTIELNRNYPTGTWTTLATPSYIASPYVWTVSGPAATNARIRITSVAFPTVTDVSDTNFSIVPQTVTVVTPNGGENWAVSDTVRIRWTRSNPFNGPVRVELNRNYPTGTWDPIAASVASDSTTWIVIEPLTANARVRVVQIADATVADSSNANFSIVPKIRLTRPNGGETLTTGINDTIRFNRIGGTGLVVEAHVNRNYPSGTWELVSEGNADILVWAVTGTTNTTTARMRVRYMQFNTIADTSNANFSIIVNGLNEFGLEIPKVFALGNAYPNPFNATTSFKVAVPKNADVRIALYNLMGQKVVDLHNGNLKAGWHRVSFRGDHLSSGSYIVKMDAPGFTNSQMIQLVK